MKMGDKVKTFTKGLVGGLMEAFKSLDKDVEGLGDIEIKSINDEYYILTGLTHNTAIPGNNECLKRTIVYRQR